jgi:hypothetical protein
LCFPGPPYPSHYAYPPLSPYRTGRARHPPLQWIGRGIVLPAPAPFATQLLEGASEDFWQPIFLGAAENRLWTEVAGLFAEDSEDIATTDQAQPSPPREDHSWTHVDLLPCLRPGNRLPSRATTTPHTLRRTVDLGVFRSGAQKPMSRPRARKSKASGSMPRFNCCTLVAASLKRAY